MPERAQGIRILPPMSVPTPRGDPIYQLRGRARQQLTLEGQKGTLAAAGASRRRVAVPGAGGVSPDVVVALGDHHGSRDVGLAEDDTTLLAQELRQLRVDGRGVVSPRNEADGRVHALDVEVVLERDGETVQRSSGLAGLGVGGVDRLGALNRIVKQDLGQTVGLSLVRVRVQRGAHC